MTIKSTEKTNEKTNEKNHNNERRNSLLTTNKTGERRNSNTKAIEKRNSNNQNERRVSNAFINDKINKGINERRISNAIQNKIGHQASLQMATVFNAEQITKEWKSQVQDECDSCPFGCIIVNSKSVVEQCNEASSKIFKYERDELLNMELSQLIPPDMRKAHKDMVKQFFAKSNWDYQEKQVDAYTKGDDEVQVNVGFMMKTLSLEESELQVCVCMVRPLEIVRDKQLIMPNNPMYISWILFMFAFISGSMILLPYEAVFNTSESPLINYVIQITTILDIMFNFNCAQVYNDKIYTDRSAIVQNYLLTQFIIDFQTGVPLEVYNIIFRGTLDRGVLMGLKLLRSLKLVKYYQTLQDKQMIELLSKNPIFKQVNKFIDYQNLLQEFLLLFSFMLVQIHFICSIWVAISQLNQSGGNNWVQQSGIINEQYLRVTGMGDGRHVFDSSAGTQLPFDESILVDQDWRLYINNNPLSAYFKTYFEIASTFLMYKMIESFNIAEYLMSLIVFFSGILFLAQTIGRLTNLLINERIDESISNRVFDVLLSVSGEYELNDEIIDKLIKETKHNAKENNPSNDKKLLKPFGNIQIKLMNEQQSDMLEKHMFLRKLPLDYLDTFQRVVKFKKDACLFQANSSPQDIFFIVKGKVELVDNNNKIIHDYQSNEVVGFKELQQFIRRVMHIPNMRDYDVDERDVNSDRSRTHRIKTEASLKYKYTANASFRSEQIALSFFVLEDLIRKDQSMQRMLEGYIMNEDVISAADITQSIKEMRGFKLNEDPGIIFTISGDLYQVNDEFTKILGIDVNDTRISGKSFADLIFTQDDKAIESHRSVAPGKYILKIDNKSFDVEMQIQYKTLMLSKQRQRCGKSKNVQEKKDCIFTTFKMTNSIEAFLVKKVKGVKHLLNVLTYEQVHKNEKSMIKQEDDDGDEEFQSLLAEMTQNNLKIDDIKAYIAKYTKKPLLLTTKSKKSIHKSPTRVFNTLDENALNQNLNNTDNSNNKDKGNRKSVSQVLINNNENPNEEINVENLC